MMSDNDIRIAVAVEVPEIGLMIGAEVPEVSIGVSGAGIRYPEYQGPYSVVPGAIAQRLETRGKVSADDIIIGPIPQNYGLITYNGTTITVS